MPGGPWQVGWGNFQIQRLYIDCTQTHPPQGGPGIHWGWCQGDEWGSSIRAHTHANPNHIQTKDQ